VAAAELSLLLPLAAAASIHFGAKPKAVLIAGGQLSQPQQIMSVRWATWGVPNQFSQFKF